MKYFDKSCTASAPHFRHATVCYTLLDDNAKNKSAVQSAKKENIINKQEFSRSKNLCSSSSFIKFNSSLLLWLQNMAQKVD